MKDRGMMKWAPYKSLNQQGDYLTKMAYERGKTPRPLHSEEKAASINDILVHYDGGLVSLRYYDNGYVREITANLNKVDPVCRYLFIADMRIAFRDIVDLKNVND